jgi:hypothetical protein
MIGRRLYQTNGSRLRLLSLSILITSTLVVMTSDNALQSHLATFTNYLSVFY